MKAWWVLGLVTLSFLFGAPAWAEVTSAFDSFSGPLSQWTQESTTAPNYAPLAATGGVLKPSRLGTSGTIRLTNSSLRDLTLSMKTNFNSDASFGVGLRGIPSNLNSGYELDSYCLFGRCELSLVKNGQEVSFVPIYNRSGYLRVELKNVGTSVQVDVYQNNARVISYTDSSPGELLNRAGFVRLFIGQLSPGDPREISEIDDFAVASMGQANLVPFYRAYSRTTDAHFFTASFPEYVNAILSGYVPEGIAFGVRDTQVAESFPLYRLYNKQNGRHYYTTNSAERDSLLSLINPPQPNVGYRNEGIAAYLYTPQSSGGLELYRLYNKNSGAHLYTNSRAERDGILTRYPGTWLDHGVVGKTR